ncbi:MAG: hypothetical protein CAF45_015575 [Nitrospira sp. CG24E]|nr:MAG: hypothetical protein CAF45_015575 [Nitrospira sp. CG24E]
MDQTDQADHGSITDIPGVEHVVDAFEVLSNYWIEEAMGIGDYSEVPSRIRERSLSDPATAENVHSVSMADSIRRLSEMPVPPCGYPVIGLCHLLVKTRWIILNS